MALLDNWLGGMRDGAVHLFTGGTGSGKSTVALHFAEAGLRRGEVVAMLVHARERDVRAHAQYLGIDLATPLREERLLLFRYHSEFAKRLKHAPSPGDVMADLERVVLLRRPARVIVDTITPFVSGAPPAGPMVAALADLLQRDGGRALLTFPEDVADGYDRSLEPLLQSAAAVIRLVREDADVRRAELVSARYASPVATAARFLIRAGVGIATEHAVGDERPTLRMS
jgi:KaiC/GvpD/RAD55 family RecA-like ATPase